MLRSKPSKNGVFILFLVLFTWLPFHLVGQIYRFGDTLGFFTKTLNYELVENGTKAFDLDCDGVDDLNFEVLSTSQLKRTAINQLTANSQFEIAIFSTGKVKYYQFQDTIQCISPDLWTNFNFLVLGITSPGGYFGNCCFDHEYIGFRKTEAADTLLGWIKISSEFSPNARIQFHEFSYQKNCPTSSTTQPNLSADIKISPNPFSDRIQCHIPEAAGLSGQLQIYAINGTLVAQYPIPAQPVFELDTKDLRNGVYFIKIGPFSYKIVK